METLSDKLCRLHDLKKHETGFAIKAGDVKDFIRELKDGLSFDYDDMPQAVQERQNAIDLIDKLAGDKLI